MTEPDDRPDGSYAIHKRRAAPNDSIEPAPLDLEEPAPLDLEEPPPLDLEEPPPLDLEEPPPLDLEEPAPLDLAPAPAFDLDLPPPRAAQAAAAAEPEPNLTRPEPLASRRKPGEPAVELESVAAPTSSYARSALHDGKQVPFRRVLPPPPETWWRRKLPHMILGAIALALGSYLYGCTKVMGDSVSFRREFSEVQDELRAMNARGEVLTPRRVEEASRKVARKHDLDLVRVEVIGEEIGNLEQGGGGCAPRNWPDTIMRLGTIEHMNLVKLGRFCAYPDYILTVRAHVEERWGLFHHSFEEVTYVTVHKWSPSEVTAGE